MPRVSMFNSPLFVGFDQIERMIDQVSKTKAEGYPPYNIEQIDTNHYRVTIAVAGFAEDDLSVTVEDNQLVVRGRQDDDESDRVYLHRGIAARQFQRTFVLAEGMEVISAQMERGLLLIDLERPIPEPQIRKVTIRSEAETRPTRTIDMTAGHKD